MQDPMHLLARGFRFVARGSDFTWRKPGDAKIGDVDCTDMTEYELYCQIVKSGGIFKFCPVPTAPAQIAKSQGL